MAKFAGKLGFAYPEETAPGVWVDTIEEKPYRGDVTRNYYKWQEGDKVNSDFSISNAISIVADEFAYNHLAFIKYVYWMGARWRVQGVEVQRPRLILTLGGVYNGEESCCEEEPCGFAIPVGEDPWV